MAATATSSSASSACARDTLLIPISSSLPSARRSSSAPWWPRHEVLTEQLGTKTIDHRELGTLRLHHLQSVPTSHPDLRLTQFAPADDSTRATLQALR